VRFAVRGGLQAGGIGSLGMARDLHRVLDDQPAALRAGHGALDEDQAALDVGADDLEILLGAVLVAHMAGHLLVLEDLAWILALTGRTERTVRHRDAVGSAKTTEAPALHAALKALALGHALDVDDLAGNIMVGRDLRADVEERILGNAEFDQLGLELDFRLGEMAALRLGNILGLGAACAKLDGGVAVTIIFAAGNDLQAFQ